MHPVFRLPGLLLAIGWIAIGAADEPDVRLANWPQFRGPLATGVAPLADPPTEWSETKNLRWKIEIPGLGHSSPIVWGDRIYLTSAIPVGDPLPEPKYIDRPGAHNNLPVTRSQRFVVIAIDRKDGRILWETAVREEWPHEGGHETGSYASATPVTDGDRVFAFFGSRGLFCLDLEGKILWEKDFGDQFTKHGHGEGSSPVLHEGILAVNWDTEEESFVAALDAKTGREIWRRSRDEKTSWSTPVAIQHEGRTHLIVSATTAARGYDLETGEVIWECGGLASNVVASPVAEPGYVYLASSYEFQSMMGIRLDGAAGDITGTGHVIWKRSQRTPYVPSPLLYDGVLYFLAHYQGVLSRMVGKTGEEATGPFRLPGLREVYASPVAAAGRIYFVDRSGVTVVISNDPTPQPLAANLLEDRFSATPALAGNTIFLRGERFLYAIGDAEKP